MITVCSENFLTENPILTFVKTLDQNFVKENVVHMVSLWAKNRWSKKNSIQIYEITVSKPSI